MVNVCLVILFKIYKVNRIKVSDKRNGVKVQYLNARCGGVEVNVKVLEIGVTRQKYKHKIVLKYST